jgi:hypothetical protein
MTRPLGWPLQVEELKLENLRAKEEALRHRIEQENKVYQDKLEVAQRTKEERADIERLLAESRLLARKEALEQKDTIRKQQEDARRKIETFKLQKLTAVRVAAACSALASRVERHLDAACSASACPSCAARMSGPRGVRAAAARGNRRQAGQGAGDRAAGAAHRGNMPMTD